MPRSAHAAMARAGGMDDVEQLAASVADAPGTSAATRGMLLPLPGLDHRGGTERQQAHHGAHFEPRGAGRRECRRTS